MGEGVKSSPFLKSVAHILQSYNDETWYSFTLPKEDSKDMNHVTHHVLRTLVFFHQKSAKFAISKNTDIDFILTYNFEFFQIFWVLKDCLSEYGDSFDNGLFKINLFWNNSYDVIISNHDIINKILWRESDHIVDFVYVTKVG